MFWSVFCILLLFLGRGDCTVISVIQPTSLDRSLSSKLITTIDMSVFVQGVRESGPDFQRHRCIIFILVCSADTLPLPCWLKSQNKHRLEFAFIL